MKKVRYLFIGTAIAVFLSLSVSANAQTICDFFPFAPFDPPALTDALWGADPSPCEDAFGSDPENRIIIDMNQREREILHLALEGFKEDMKHEIIGTGIGLEGDPARPWPVRFAFLDFFVTDIVPILQERVQGATICDFPTPLNNKAMIEESIQTVELGECERIGASIALDKWSIRRGGQMRSHLVLCKASEEMRGTNACASFFPLGDAYLTLKKKLEKDQ